MRGRKWESLGLHPCGSVSLKPAGQAGNSQTKAEAGIHRRSSFREASVLLSKPFN